MTEEIDSMSGNLSAMGGFDGLRDIYVNVELPGGKYEWRTVRAANISAGMTLAEKMPGVVRVLEGSNVPGGAVT